jgi:hypothetical protein
LRNCIISREAVEAGFGADVDYAQLIKLYGETPHPAGRYSPAQIKNRGPTTHVIWQRRF